MNIIGISTARKQLSKIVDSVYLEDREYIIIKGNIPLARISKVDIGKTTRAVRKKDLDTSLFGILNSKKDSITLAKELRIKAWLRS